MDLAVTDPPYGIGYQSALAKRGRRKQAIANDAADDHDAFLSRALPAIKSVMKRGAVLYWFAGGGGGEPVLAKALLAIAQHFTLLNTIVWDKLDPGLGWRSAPNGWRHGRLTCTAGCDWATRWTPVYCAVFPQNANGAPSGSSALMASAVGIATYLPKLIGMPRKE